MDHVVEYLIRSAAACGTCSGLKNRALGLPTLICRLDCPLRRDNWHGDMPVRRSPFVWAPGPEPPSRDNFIWIGAPVAKFEGRPFAFPSGSPSRGVCTTSPDSGVDILHKIGMDSNAMSDAGKKQRKKLVNEILSAGCLVLHANVCLEKFSKENLSG